MTAMGIAFSVLFLAIHRDDELVHHPLDAAATRAALRRFGIGTLLYVATIALSFVDAVVVLIAHALIAAYYCFDQLGSGRVAASTGGTGSRA